MEAKRKVILDCDPGHDDAVAIIMLGKNPRFDVLGICTVRGNQTLERTTINALNVCQYLQLDIPVYKGCDIPLVREPEALALEGHGKTGLDGPVFDKLERRAEEKHAVDFIIDSVMEAPGEVTLIITGPMTNVALAMRREPAIIPNLKEIVFMGGSYSNGNRTPAAEFNILADAEAAHIVLASGVKLTMMGLDLTRQALCKPEVIARMDKVNNSASRLFVDMMKFFSASQLRMYNWPGGPLHDPTCVAYLINPDCIETRFVNVEIDIRSTQSYGRTNCDIFGRTDKLKNVHVSTKLDVELFWDIVEECLRAYD